MRMQNINGIIQLLSLASVGKSDQIIQATIGNSAQIETDPFGAAGTLPMLRP